MLNLNSKIIVYETDKDLKPTDISYEFRYVKHIDIHSNYKNLTDTATIQIPKKLNPNWLSISEGFDVNINTSFSEEKSIHDFFKLDYYVEIFLGYDGDFKPAFRGYITEVKGDAPVTIYCQDLMYSCKKQKVVATALPKENNDIMNITAQNPSVNIPGDIKGYIESRFAELAVPFDVVIEAEEIGELIINRNWSVCQLLDHLKEKHKIWSYFELGDTKSKLWITNNPTKFSLSELESVVDKYLIDIPIPGLGGLGSLISAGISKVTSTVASLVPSRFFGGTPKFQFFDTIISDNLKVVDESVKNIRVRAQKFVADSNTPFYLEMGDPEGELIESKTLHDNQTTMPKDPTAFKEKVKEIQNELKDYLAPRLAHHRRTGLSGTITVFGEPFVRPTDAVILTNAEDKEKNGTFQVESVKRTYGEGGYRQEIELGRRVA